VRTWSRGFSNLETGGTRHQHAGQNRNKTTGNKSFVDVEKCKYVRTTVTNQTYIHEEIIILNSGNAYPHLVPYLLSTCLLSEDVKIKTERRLRVFLNKEI
jgi:hypothetical protein